MSRVDRQPWSWRVHHMGHDPGFWFELRTEPLNPEPITRTKAIELEIVKMESEIEAMRLVLLEPEPVVVMCDHRDVYQAWGNHQCRDCNQVSSYGDSRWWPKKAIVLEPGK